MEIRPPSTCLILNFSDFAEARFSYSVLIFTVIDYYRTSTGHFRMTFRPFQVERKCSNSFVPRRLSFSLHLELGRDRKKKTREIQNSLSLPSLLQTRQGEKRGPGNEVRNISFPCRRRQVISPHVAACGIDCLLVCVKAKYEKKYVSRPDFY